tara:strand:+ start:63 stop:239 length:177 start_codon:yes stop_codon:yes gene_type:complete
MIKKQQKKSLFVNKERAEDFASLGIEYLETDKEGIYKVNLSDNERQLLIDKGYVWFNM